MKTKNNKTIIALGADIKSRFCLLKKGNLSISQEFGDLNDSDNFDKFRSAILKLKARPDIVAFDMHPGYFSVKAAELFDTGNKVSVQHHHAHIASFMFGNGFKKPIMGVVFDGTGFGSDGNLWGGEFMIVDKSGFKRVAHLKYLRMPGAEAAVREPWRMAFSILYDCLGKGALKLNLDCLKIKPKKDYNVLIKMIEQNINSPLTSGAGRLFDAVSSILGICHKADFEAQAAIALEKIASRSETTGFYEMDIFKDDNCFVVGYNKLIKGILGDMAKGLAKEDIARKFHNSLAETIIKVTKKSQKAYNIKDIVLSGGVFQNKLLFNAAAEKLGDCGYNLFNKKGIPLNDLGICIGQAYAALHYWG
ncbi:MAG: hypothetical protein PHY46_04695 [Candidatus Omnitrophica bacterium]|nr:hypothetical protein [Candidatus Omnitrophota bacterium]